MSVKAADPEAILPQEVINNYDIVAAKPLEVAAGNKFMVYGLKVKELNLKIRPESYLAVCRSDGRMVYRFSPVVPKKLAYPRPLMIEKVEVSANKIVTAWGETGADYFGTHPIVFSFNKNKFKAVSFYGGRIANSPRINKYFWTRKDFTVSNYFNRRDAAKTILSQGVLLKQGGVLELSFYADNRAHADPHRYVKFELNL